MQLSYKAFALSLAAIVSLSFSAEAKSTRVDCSTSDYLDIGQGLADNNVRLQQVPFGVAQDLRDLFRMEFTAVCEKIITPQITTTLDQKTATQYEITAGYKTYLLFLIFSQVDGSLEKMEIFVR